ncbi:putative Membrane fusion protein (MFP) family protein [Azospirillaceae bacterium]
MTKKNVSQEKVNKKTKKSVGDLVRHPLKAAALLYSSPSLAIRGTIYGMFVLMVIMVVYSCIATTDETVTVPMTLQRQSTTVQAISTGRVYQVRVKENDHVNRGDTIAIIQETIRASMTPEQEQMNKDKIQVQERRGKVVSDYTFRKQQMESQLSDIERRQVEDKGRLITNLGKMRDSLASNEAKLGKAIADLASAQSALGRLQPLCARHDIPITQCEQAQQNISNLSFNQKTTENDIASLKRSIQQSEKDQKDLEDQTTATRLRSELQQAKIENERDLKIIDSQIDDLEIRIRKSVIGVKGIRPMDDRENKDKLVYTAPFDGVITTLSIKSNEIINALAPIAVIVDDNAPLQGRVLIPNRDIGNVTKALYNKKKKPSQNKDPRETKLRYFAYPEKTYGVQIGYIQVISSRPSSVPTENSSYVGTIALKSEFIQRLKSNDAQPLTIGLQGSAEIKVGEKKYIELLFKPASRWLQEQEDEPQVVSNDNNSDKS